MKLKDFVSHFKNSKNNQEKLEIKKLKLKENNLSIDDLLNIEIKGFSKKKLFNEERDWR
ncbi:MAG: hypothetical protein PHX47_02490 [Candidatus ainarchaeum sp.]|nr:hypothetical protein [Candidatus ainarchaeum sp.]